MPPLDAATRESLQNALYAYVQTYGGASITEVRAIAGSLLAVKETAGDLIAVGLEIETWVDEIVQDFDLSIVADRLQDEGARSLAAQAQHWRETVEAKAQATLDAYIQKYVPELDTQQLHGLVATILPVVEDAKISRDEAHRLIHDVSAQLDWQAALERVVAPQWAVLAEKTMQCVINRDVEASVTEVMNAYVYNFQPTAVEIGEGLVEQAVQAVTNSKLALDLDLELDAETQKLLVKQVVFKLNLMAAGHSPSKTAVEIAQQLNDEVVRYRREHELDPTSILPATIRTDDTNDSSPLGGEISVGIELQPSTAATEDLPETSA